MLIESILIVCAPMALFITGVTGIIVAPGIKKKIKLAKDSWHKGENDPQHATYSFIVGSMANSPDEWGIEPDRAVWPRSDKGKYQILLYYNDKNDELEISMMRDGGHMRPIRNAYWKKFILQLMREQAFKLEAEKTMAMLFPNGVPQLLLTKG